MIAIGSKRTPTNTNGQLPATPSHLILTSPKNQLNMLNQSNNKNEINSLPLSKEHRSSLVASQQMVNSQSYDANLSMHAASTAKNNETSPSVNNNQGSGSLTNKAANMCMTPTNNNTTSTANNGNHTPVMQLMSNKSTLHNFNKTNLNSPKSRSSATPNLQKYYSFQKPAFNMNESKCNCFNMPFVCEVCTTRFFEHFFD